EHHRAGVASAEREDQGPDGGLRGAGRLRAHVVPGDDGRPQRAADAAGRRPDRLRPRLPRRHLRSVRGGHRRRGPRPAADHHLPAAHALVRRRRHDRRGALARRRLPGGQGPDGRPGRLRPDHPGRRLHLRADRDRAGRARLAHPEGQLRPRVRGRRLHRLRRLRGSLPQRLGDAVHRVQGDPPGAAAPGPAGAPLARPRHGRPA
ncbi:MAG: Succinate dehydrogenase iron-sulfur protein, partial [uncultured Friedmanniella sp.]